MRAHLAPRLFGTLQRFIHGDHWRSFGLFTRMLDLNPGERVVEIGCGIGSLAQHFVEQGFEYWGLDIDPARVEVAQKRNPQGHFLIADVTTLEPGALPPFRRAFVHGVLHHLDDHECRKVIDTVLALRSDMVLSVIEPYAPDHWWQNPIASLLARLDEGKYVRTLRSWRNLFRPQAVLFEQIRLWPRWPVGMVVARMIPASTGQGAGAASGTK